MFFNESHQPSSFLQSHLCFMLGPVVGSLSQPVWGYKGDKGNLEWPHPQLARAKWAWRASPLPLSLGGHTGDSEWPGRRGEPGPGYGCVHWDFPSFPRGAVQQFQSLLIAPVNSGVRPRSILSSYGRLMSGWSLHFYRGLQMKWQVTWRTRKTVLARRGMLGGNQVLVLLKGLHQSNVRDKGRNFPTDSTSVHSTIPNPLWVYLLCINSCDRVICSRTQQKHPGNFRKLQQTNQKSKRKETRDD